MQKDWILDVLADLREFALSNNLPTLAEQLDDTALVALAEISQRGGNGPGQGYRDGHDARGHLGGSGASGHA